MEEFFRTVNVPHSGFVAGKFDKFCVVSLTYSSIPADKDQQKISFVL